MSEFKIDGRMKVKTLKANFKNLFEGTLRVYNGNVTADDEALLCDIRANDDAKCGEMVCRGSLTVGSFEENMWNLYGIKVQVASPDDWVLALDGIALSKLKDIPKNATKAKMEPLLPKASIKIVSTMKACDLIDQFREVYGGTLRLYNKNVRVSDGAFLSCIRSNEGARGGNMVCHEGSTVGEFEKEMWEVFGIKVQVASPDDWVLALDEMKLAKLKDIPKNSTKASMQSLLD